MKQIQIVWYEKAKKTAVRPLEGIIKTSAKGEVLAKASFGEPLRMVRPEKRKVDV